MRMRWPFWLTNYLTLSPSRWLVTAANVQMRSHLGRRRVLKLGAGVRLMANVMVMLQAWFLMYLERFGELFPASWANLALVSGSIHRFEAHLSGPGRAKTHI